MSAGTQRAGRLSLPALAVGGVGLALCLAGLAVEARAVLAGWLTAALFLLGLPLGAMVILMIHWLTGGEWGKALGRSLRAMVATLPLALILLLPVTAGIETIFPWAAQPAEALPAVVRAKLAYLNQPFLLLRLGLYVLVWLALAWVVLARLPGASIGEEHPAGKLRWSVAGLLAHALAVTFFSVDWMMSLEPEFYSTIYPLIEAAGQVVGAYAVAMIVVAATRAIDERPGGDEHVLLAEDIANLMFGFVMAWVYLAFMQWLIVWAADLPREIVWYLHRTRNGWQAVLWLLVILHFAVPFAAFLNRDLKRSRAGVIALGCVVLAAHLIDVFWRIQPPLGGDGFPLHWADVAAFAGLGGVWVAGFLYALSHAERIEAWLGRAAHG